MASGGGEEWKKCCGADTGMPASPEGRNVLFLSTLARSPCSINSKRSHGESASVFYGSKVGYKTKKKKKAIWLNYLVVKVRRGQCYELMVNDSFDKCKDWFGKRYDGSPFGSGKKSNETMEKFEGKQNA